MSDMSVREVSQFVGVTEQAVRKALAAGRLVGQRGEDGAWVVDSDDAQRWFASRERSARQESGTATPPVRAARRRTGPSPEVSVLPALRGLIQSQEQLLRVIRDLADEIERTTRADSDAAVPTG